jgi:hypothetical protein
VQTTPTNLRALIEQIVDQRLEQKIRELFA